LSGFLSWKPTQGLGLVAGAVPAAGANLDVIKSADYVIDLGPEGGSGGGRIVAQGTPEAVSRSRESFTGRFLAEIFTAA
jgi:excinuclease UvrABC ATPase subunit